MKFLETTIKCTKDQYTHLRLENFITDTGESISEIDNLTSRHIRFYGTNNEGGCLRVELIFSDPDPHKTEYFLPHPSSINRYICEGPIFMKLNQSLEIKIMANSDEVKIRIFV